MNSANVNYLSEIYDTSDIVFICDSSAVKEDLTSRRIPVVDINEINDCLPKAGVSISTSMAHFRKIGSLIRNSSQTQLLSVPQAVFDSSDEAGVYSVELLLKSNFAKALRLQDVWLDIITNAKEKLIFRNGNSEIECKLADNVRLTILKDKKLTPGYFRSVAEFFEVSFDHVADATMPCFCVNGKLDVKGILVAKAPSYSGDLSLVPKALSLLQEVASAERSTLIVKDNQVTSFSVDGKEYVQDLLAFAGNVNQLNVTEFAIGINDDIAKDINYHINSQLNEGIDGIHLGLGDGSTGLHIDFLSPGMRFNI